jgi:hypothetical protein
MTQLNEGTFHRGIGYSINYLGDGKWRWKLHPDLKFGSEATPIICGEISGTRDEAATEAKKAIDTHFGQSSN